tara:strand:- start:86 stop:646 length:561 start_codon:yes stop_codon:yes gene_type:complete
MNVKWISIGVVGALFGVSHIGMIGYIATRDQSKLPKIDIPITPYTSYVASVSEDGYKISYTANDPKTMHITTSIKEKAGFLGLSNNTKEVVEEYVMDGKTNQGGAVSNHRSWLDGQPGLTQSEAQQVTDARKSEPVLKQSDQQKVQAESSEHLLVLVLLLLLVVSPILVGLLLVGLQCLVVIRVLK